MVTARAIVGDAKEPPAEAGGRVFFWGRVGYSLGLGLLIGMHVGGYMAWAENAKTPEAGAASVLVLVGVFAVLMWTSRR